LILLTILASAAPAAAQSTIAVLPFENGGSYGQDKETFDALRLGLQAPVISELERAQGAQVLDRAAVARAPGLADGEDHVVDAATAATAGKAIGARHVVLGEFVDHYGRFRIDARIVDVNTGRIVDVVSNDPALRDRRDLHARVKSVAGGIAEVLELQATPSDRNIPAEAITAFSKGLLFMSRGNRSEAAASYERALQVAPDFAEARAALGQAR